MSMPDRPERRSPFAATLGLIAIPAGVLVLIGLLTPTAAFLTWAVDPLAYRENGQSLLSGLVPYRDYSFEYPPLSLLPMALPQLLVGGDASLSTYRWVFLLQNAVISCGIGAALAWLAHRQWAPGGSSRVLTVYALSIVAIAPLVAWRFDILVGLFVVLALLATVKEQPTLAGMALGLGALAKLYPAFLLPVFLVRYVARGEVLAAVRMLTGFLLPVALVMLPLIVVSGRAAFYFIDWQQVRGVEIESVVSGLVLLAHLVFGADAAATHAFNSWQISSPLADVLASPLLILTLVSLALILAAAFRAFRAEHRGAPLRRGDLLSASLVAVLLVVILTNKVFSPQYLVWLLPLAALRPLREAILLAVAGGLTLTIFLLNWPQLLALDPGVIILLNVRNLLLVVLLGWVAWRIASAAREHD
jgi:glycosyl transferase family 87